MNLFEGSMLCLLAIGDGDKDFYKGDEKNWSEYVLELIKVPVGVSQSSKENFQKMNDHEIIYHHKLYDVVKQFVKGNLQYYYCVNDSKEEIVLERIKQCMESHLDYFGSTNHPTPVRVKLFTVKNFSIGESKKNLPLMNFIFSFLIDGKTQNVLPKKLNPPPEILFS